MGIRTCAMLLLIGVFSSSVSLAEEGGLGCPAKEFQEIREYVMLRESFVESLYGARIEEGCVALAELLNAFRPARWLACTTNDELHTVIQGDQQQLIPTLIEKFTPHCGPPCMEEDLARRQRFIVKLRELRNAILVSEPDFPCTEGLDLLELFSPYREFKCLSGDGTIHDMGARLFELSGVVLKNCRAEYNARQQGR